MKKDIDPITVEIAEKRLAGKEMYVVNAYDILDNDVKFLSEFQRRFGSSSNVSLDAKKGNKEGDAVIAQMKKDIDVACEFLSKAVQYNEDHKSPLQYGTLKSCFDIRIVIEPKN